MSGTNGIYCLQPLRAAIRRALPVSIGLAGLLLAPPAVLAEDQWDCTTAPGGGWQCSKNGRQAEDSPPTSEAKPAEPVITPLAEPSQPDVEPVSPADESKIEPVAPAATPEPAPSKPTPAETSPEPAASTQRIAPATRKPAAAQAFDTGEMPDVTATPASQPTTQPQAVPVTETPPGATPAEDGVAATAAVPNALDEGIDWGTCQISASPTGRPTLPPSAPADYSQPIDVTADGAIAEIAPEKAEFSGNVVLVQGGLRMQADRVIVDRASGNVDADGNIVIIRPDVRIAGQSANYQLATGEGQIDQASYRVPAIHARGDAEHAEFLSDGKSRYQNISYSTCQPGSDDWVLNASELELDRAEGFGTAHHATLRFMGTPILYAPVFTFPIDDRRRSGVLIPTVGQSSNTGFDLSVPYYFNLAENYDLTVTPRLMTKRGLMLGGEFRFLTESTQGTLAADYLPNDREYGSKDDDRGSVSLRTHTNFTDRLKGDVNFNYVSDEDYFRDLGGSLAVTSTAHVQRAATVRYLGDTWDFLGRVQKYQTIDEDIADEDKPYSRLPQLLFDMETPDGLAGTKYHLNAEYVNFDRKDSVHGHRIDLFPAISLPLRETWGYIEPKIGVRYVGYDLTDQVAGLDDSPSHATGMFSFDSGLYFDRSTEFFGKGATQTLEPRLYYLYVPYTDQDDQPIFDTNHLDFRFDNLFRDNRFNGPDRFGDANQVTLALTSRFLSDQTGTELLRASIGQTLYFENREVNLPGEADVDDSTSALVGEIAARLGGGWHTRAGLQWDSQNGSGGNIDQALAQISYRDSRRRIFNAAYRLRDEVTEQTDLAFIWPINEQFSLIGRHNYSLQENRLLEALVGVEYGQCCWRLRGLIRQYTDSSGDDHNLAFMLQLELNGLGRLGNDIDSTLEDGIYGYRTDDDNYDEGL